MKLYRSGHQAQSLIEERLLQSISILQGEANPCHASLLNHPTFHLELVRKESCDCFTRYDTVNHRLRERRPGITAFIRMVGFPCALGKKFTLAPDLRPDNI